MTHGIFTAGRRIGFLVTDVARPLQEHRSFKVVELPLAGGSGAVARTLYAFRTMRDRA